ncbi:hypothetical protein SK128_019397 [Halocaridina rubra]|uniref:Uncharacterized protein n=1 Tax=Halocaridina rubra TaxID=373956 RepID=A0AAN8WDV8_HALRR
MRLLYRVGRCLPTLRENYHLLKNRTTMPNDYPAMRKKLSQRVHSPPPPKASWLVKDSKSVSLTGKLSNTFPQICVLKFILVCRCVSVYKTRLKILVSSEATKLSLELASDGIINTRCDLLRHQNNEIGEMVDKYAIIYMTSHSNECLNLNRTNVFSNSD